MDKVRVLIVEDEAITAESLSEVLSQLGYITSGIAIDALEAIDILNKENTDIAILDINIQGDKDGIWIADLIHKKYNIPFVFLTAYEDEKILARAIKTNPGAYLLKPYTKIDLSAAIQLAIQNFALKQTASSSQDTINNENTAPIKLSEAIFIKNDYMFNKVVINEIILLKSDGHYVEIHTTAKKYLVRAKLSDFSSILPNELFIRVNRSYLVNINCIDKFGTTFLYVNNTEIHLGKAYREELTQRLKTFL